DCQAPPSGPLAGALRPSANVPVLEVTVSQMSDNVVVRVKGEATDASAGALLDGLLPVAARRPTVVILDLSELSFISSRAMGLRWSYRRGVVRRGGRVQLADACQPAVKEALVRAGLLDLFETTMALGPVPILQAGQACTGVKFLS